MFNVLQLHDHRDMCMCSSSGCDLLLFCNKSLFLTSGHVGAHGGVRREISNS